MTDHMTRSRQVIGMSDTAWQACILGWAFGVVVTIALMVIGKEWWTILATFLGLMLCMTYRIVLTRQSIRIALMIPWFSKEIAWRNIAGVEVNELRNAVRLRLTGGVGVVGLPQWFTSMDVQTLAQICSQWHGTHMMRTCESCGYDLFGTQSSTCPECGHDIPQLPETGENNGNHRLGQSPMVGSNPTSIQ